MHTAMDGRRATVSVSALITAIAVVAACSGGAPSVAPSATPPPTVAPSATPPQAASPSQRPTGPATVSAPTTVAAGATFEVDWTGPNANGDYVTIVPEGATAWTNESYFGTSSGSPGRLTAPLQAGEYEVWYVDGETDAPAARDTVTVEELVGTLDGPEEVGAGEDFEVDWTGPNGPGDYVTIVAVGAERWTSESYFQTSIGPTGTLVAPTEAGDHELWYVPGQASTPVIREPITVLPFEVTLEAPDEVTAGSTFEVGWTGPDGPGDYITIVEAGAAATAYLSYAYTNTGSTVTLTAPTEPGDYEVRYTSDRVDIVFGSRPITVE
jgi:Ca-activated chloride channel homolog